MTIESHIFGGKDGKERAIKFRDKKNAKARNYRWVLSDYRNGEGYKVSKHAK